MTLQPESLATPVASALLSPSLDPDASPEATQRAGSSRWWNPLRAPNEKVHSATRARRPARTPSSADIERGAAWMAPAEAAVRPAVRATPTTVVTTTAEPSAPEAAVVARPKARFAGRRPPNLLGHRELSDKLCRGLSQLHVRSRTDSWEWALAAMLWSGAAGALTVLSVVWR